MINCLLGPAHLNQQSWQASHRAVASVWNTGMASWKLVALSTKWIHWWIFPVLAVQVIRSHPTQSLNSRTSDKAAGRAIRGSCSSWHVLQWKSPTPCRISGLYPCCFNTSCSFTLLGCPRLWCTLESHCRVTLSNCRNLDHEKLFGVPTNLVLSSTSFGTRLSSSPSMRGFSSWGNLLSICSGAGATLSGDVIRGCLDMSAWFWSGTTSSMDLFRSFTSLLAKTVNIKRMGGDLAHNWRLLKFSHCIQEPFSVDCMSCRSNPRDNLQGASCRASRTGGLRKRSVPLHSSMTRTR